MPDDISGLRDQVKELRDGSKARERRLREFEEKSITRAELQVIRNSYVSRVEFTREYDDFMSGETLDVTEENRVYCLRAISRGFAIDVSNHTNGHKVERHHL